MKWKPPSTKMSDGAVSLGDANPPTVRLSGQLLNLLMIALSIAAAYFMTIQSLKIELAAKAENVVVETLDRRLTRFEVLLKEGVVSKEEFYQFSRDIDKRLARIEYHLLLQSGEQGGKK